jgi:hypothetical protein
MDGIATGLSTAITKDGTQTTTAKIPFAVGLSVIDNQTILLGTNSDIAIQYDETTNDSLEISANVEGAALGIVLKSDQGDDNADQHKLSIADGGTLTLGSKISGSFVSYLTHTPNSTVASSTTAVAGNLTVGGNLTLGSGAELSEAELEMLDGITAGTVAASKAVVVDANKDIASFRNVTLTGELDAATGDFSGDVDVDGTLEADAITVNGTALATVIAGTTVTTATNANHVSVADNESTNEENLIPFIEDASATGNVGLESDGDFAYNPSTGTVSATVFKGNIDAVDGDFDGTLEADAITLNGTAITATATLSTGISNGNLPVFTSGVADDDFLRVNGTSIEGRSASEVLSDIGASAVAGSSSIVTTGALDTGSITSNFGTINNGASAITTTGVGSFGSLDISGDIDVDGTTNLDVVDIDGAVDMASTLAVAGVVTANAGVVVDEMTLDGDTLTATDDFILDVAGVINLDSDGGGIYFKDGGTTIAEFINNSSDFELKVAVQDKDIRFRGNDGGTAITALTLDMSAGGVAKFGAAVQIPQYLTHLDDTDTFLEFKDDQIDIYAGNKRQLILGTGEVIINQDSADVDFRVESNGNAAMFSVDGGNDALGIGIASAAYGDSSTLTFNGTGKDDGIYMNVNGTSSFDFISFNNGGGNRGEISTTGSDLVYSTSSDYRLKENVEDMTDAITRLKKLKPKRFSWIIDKKDSADTDGFLAHEVTDVVPDAVVRSKDETTVRKTTVKDASGNVIGNMSKDEWEEKKASGDFASDTTYTEEETVPIYQSVDYSKLVTLLTGSLQEAVSKIETLETKVAALENA